MSQQAQPLTALALTLLIQLGGLTFAVLIDPYIRREHRRILLAIIVLVFTLVVWPPAVSLVETEENWMALNLAGSAYGYIVRPIVIALFIQILTTGKRQWMVWGLIGFNTAVYLAAFFTDAVFGYNEAGGFWRGPLGYTCFWVSGILILWLVVETVRGAGQTPKREMILPLASACVIVAAVAADYVLTFPPTISYLSAAMVSCCVFYYIWLHLQFVRAYEQALIAEQRIQIMVSQIQPHFLYNTLSTIQALCRIDPEKAFTTVEKFGTYLRQNIGSLTQSKLIPLEKELSHTKVYAEIETIRFPTIRLDYDIRDTGFLLPALTIQPLVENAIRHGVRLRAQGLITVTTCREGDCHMIRIRDNGSGFDVDAVGRTDESHIGLQNVKTRVEKLCGGSLAIDSRIGEGTAVTIRIPVGKELP